MAKLKGSFGVNVSSGNAAGFSNIPGASSYTAAFTRQFGNSFKKGYDKAQKEKAKAGAKKPGQGSGRSSEDKVTGSTPFKKNPKQLGQVYEGEVVEPKALPTGPNEPEIWDAEIVEDPKQLPGSRKAIESGSSMSPRRLELEAPKSKSSPTPEKTTPSSVSKANGTSNVGQQFTPAKSSPRERPATTKDLEAAVRKGHVLPEEATGGEWGKDLSMSDTYSKKAAANAAAHGGTNVGKQFTGPSSMPISEGPKAGFTPYVNLDNIK